VSSKKVKLIYFGTLFAKNLAKFSSVVDLVFNRERRRLQVITAWIGKLIKIILVFIVLLMIFEPVFGEDLSEQGKIIFRGKIFGDQLMLIDGMGRKSTAKDGIYTTEDGTKITVKDGKVNDIPPMFASKGMYSSCHIVEVEYFDTN